MVFVWISSLGSVDSIRLTDRHFVILIGIFFLIRIIFFGPHINAWIYIHFGNDWFFYGYDVRMKRIFGNFLEHVLRNLMLKFSIHLIWFSYQV